MMRLTKPIGKFAFWHNDIPIFVHCIGDIARCQDRRDGNPNAIIGDALTATNSNWFPKCVGSLKLRWKKLKPATETECDVAEVGLPLSGRLWTKTLGEE
jgi:hypothetical protein